MHKNNITFPTKTLRITTKLWYILFFVGQLVFASYIILLYWKSAALGNFEKLNTVIPDIFVKGRSMRNFVFALHMAIAAIVSVIGPMQLIPQLRKYAPAYHRISGRIYVIAAFIISLDGILLIWRKGATGDFQDHIIISINALIIMTCAYFTIRHAIAKNISKHNQWAVHLLLAMNGVWLFRVFFMFWMFINKGRPVGFDPDTFSGPFLDVLAVIVYIFPQAVVAYYFKAKSSILQVNKLVFTVFLALITIAMTIGILTAFLGMWLPRL